MVVKVVFVYNSTTRWAPIPVESGVITFIDGLIS